MKEPIRVAVTGAAGQIGYAILFRIASGEVFGKDQPVILQLLEITPALKAAEGVIMELHDCAFDLLSDVFATDDAEKAFKDIDAAFLIGSRPRGPGMLRADLLEANAQIFSTQGKALDKVAKKDAKILVVGNPANTNAMIAINHAPSIPSKQIHAMTRLDHNRAIGQVGQKLDVANADIKKMTIWGNHSITQYPDLYHAEINGESVYDKIGDHDWYENEFIPTVQKRGAAIIEARGASSAASAANGAVDHMHDWWQGTPEGDWVSMSILSDGNPYGIQDGLVYSFPVTVKDGEVSIVEGLEINEFSREKMEASAKELAEEQDTVRNLGLI